LLKASLKGREYDRKRILKKIAGRARDELEKAGLKCRKDTWSKDTLVDVVTADKQPKEYAVTADAVKSELWVEASNLNAPIPMTLRGWLRVFFVVADFFSLLFLLASLLSDFLNPGAYGNRTWYLFWALVFCINMTALLFIFPGHVPKQRKDALAEKIEEEIEKMLAEDGLVVERK